MRGISCISQLGTLRAMVAATAHAQADASASGCRCTCTVNFRHIHVPAMLIESHALYSVYATIGISMEILDIKDKHFER